MAGPPSPQKLCPSCGSTMPASANLCSTCGYNFHAGPYATPHSYGQNPGYGQNAGYGQVPPDPGYSQPYGQYGQPMPHWQAQYPRAGDAASGSADGMGIASLVLGILSLPTFCIWCVGPPCALLALLFGALGLKGNNRALAISGMICAGISLLVFVGLMILGVALGGLD